MSKDLSKLMDFSEPEPKEKPQKKEKKQKKEVQKEECPYCGEMFKSVGRHLPYCSKNPERKKQKKKTKTVKFDSDIVNETLDKLKSIVIDYETYQRINTVLNMLRFDKTSETFRSAIRILKGYSRSPKKEIKKEIKEQINKLLGDI